MKTKTFYSHWDVLLASATEPLTACVRQYQLEIMRHGLVALKTSAAPTTDDWRVCSDAVNLMETFVEQGHCLDASGLLMDAITALALAGKRHLGGAPIRLDGVGLQAVSSVLDDYAYVISQLPARTVISCHRLTEKRLQQIYAGKRRPHDVEIIGL